MKVILLSDVKKVGKKYEIIDVAPGFARNFLIAKGFAEPVTSGNAKRVADMQRKREVEATKQLEILEKAFKGISDTVLTFTHAANDEGHLYAAVSRTELADALGAAVGAVIPEDNIILEAPIKEIGDHVVTVALGEKKAEFKVTVSKE